jgi:hypothetical protein
MNYYVQLLVINNSFLFFLFRNINGFSSHYYLIRKMEKFDSIQNVINTSTSQQQLNGIQTVVEDSKPTTTTTVIKLVELKKASVFRLMMKLTFSNFGLVLIICMYACLGAMMFRLLEQHEELRRCEEGKGKLMKETNDLKDGLFRYVLYNVTSIEFSSGGSINDGGNSTLNKNNSLVDGPEEIIDNMLREFRNSVLFIEEKYKYNGQNCVEDSKWKFFSALLFSITVITTIGYGHVTPTTWVRVDF